MFKILSILLLLSTSGVVLSSEQLSSSDFEQAYLRYIDANTEFYKTFSGDSKLRLLSASQVMKTYSKRNAIAQLAYGSGVYLVSPKENEKVFKKMLKKSAKSGYLPAARKLAQLYRSGKHFGKRPDDAFELLVENSSFGHERDLKTLMILYGKSPRFGKSSKEYLETQKLLEESTNIEYQAESAISGSLRSQRIYAHLLYHGKHISRDYLEAAYWFTVALDNPKNSQNDYDLSRLIYAKSQLSIEQSKELNQRIEQYSHNKAIK